MPHTPHTPHTPSGGNSSGHPMTPGGPPSVPPSSQNESNANSQSGTNTNSSSSNSNNNSNNNNSNSNNSNNSNNNQNLHSPQQGMMNSNPAANIMNSPQSLMNSPQNMMNSPQNMNMQQNLMNPNMDKRYGPYGGPHHDEQSMMNNQNSLANLTDVDLNADLNFDPAAVIEGEGGNDLNVSVKT